MRIAVIGAGGIGGYLAAKLIAAGTEVAVIARGAHLAAIRKAGLVLVEAGARRAARPALATDDGAEAGPCDLVVFAVKGQDLVGAIELARPVMGTTGLALPFLNGIDAPDMLAEAFGPGRTLIGIARISATISAPGEVSLLSDFARYTIGDYAGGQSGHAVRTVRGLFQAAGIETADCDDVRLDLWRKFVMLSSFSAVTAAARVDAAGIRANPETSALFLTLVREAAAVGRASGVAIPETMVDEMIAFNATLPDDMRASLAHDLAAGKPLEVDWLSGAVARLARETGVPAPAHTAIHALLAPWRDGTP